ncbi:hypothetical protein MF271_12595 [Deinococcus sp. KNUC1210]|uniref:hypothetical protein n=1 Tax=Deinococcus sp. KNUC1210 TaxID=2917691 RepID=UPI001EEFDA2A|nr:hypothetical protein [Deinococcus sp. KNUC1210]ULH14815.1 hypothetical protein MF271_12595 [Deinococcus sp. KNUC1210]
MGAYPLRGLIWASVLPQQAYRGRTLQRAQQILSLLDTLRRGSARGLAGLPLNAWNAVRLHYEGALVVPAGSPP